MNDLTQIGSKTFRLTRNEDGAYKSEYVPGPETEPPLLAEGLLAVFPSASSNSPHLVQYKPKLGIYCTCLGYGYRRYCRYTQFIQHLVGTSETTIEALLKQPIRMKEAT